MNAISDSWGMSRNPRKSKYCVEHETPIAHDRQCRRAAEAGHGVVGDDEIPVAQVQRLNELRLGCHTSALRLVATLLEVGKKELGVAVGVFNQ